MKKLFPLTLGFLITLATFGATAAQADTQADSATPSPFVGAYFTVGESSGLPVNVLVTIYADGNFTAQFNVGNTEFVGAAFTPETGVWKKTGPREITARTLDFDFLYPTKADPQGVLVGTAIGVTVITFDAGFDEFSAAFSGAVFATEVNPLDPDEAPLFTFSGSYEGERLTVE